MKFYLGTHEPSWVAHTSVPLFLSRRRLARQGRWPRARGSWSLDSGGFTELSEYGRWTITPSAYADEAARWRDIIGGLDWIAPQDWMCEPHVLAKTGGTVAEHQARTIESVMALRGLLRGGPHVIPVLQGWHLEDYIRHIDAYREAGINLRAEPVVGVGTVCRRQSGAEGAAILRDIAGRGLRIHGFGLKTTGLRAVGHLLASADSMAWSFIARKRPPRLGCTHKSCANCRRWALTWRGEVLAPPVDRSQTRLFGPY